MTRVSDRRADEWIDDIVTDKLAADGGRLVA